jgi:hypothetical protein
MNVEVNHTGVAVAADLRLSAMAALKLRCRKRERQAHTHSREVAPVARNQTLGLLHTPGEPFKTSALHPHRSALDVADEHVHAAADADRDRHVEALEMHANPFFLLWVAKGDEQEVRLGLVNELQGVAVIHALDIGEDGGVIAADVDAGVELFELGFGAFGYAVFAAEEEDFVALASGECSELRYEVRAGDPLFERGSEHTRDPDKWHAVRQNKAAAGKNAVQVYVVERVDPEIEIGGGHLMGAAGEYQPFDCVDRFTGRDIRQGEAHDCYVILRIVAHHLVAHTLSCLFPKCCVCSFSGLIGFSEFFLSSAENISVFSLLFLRVLPLA